MITLIFMSSKFNLKETELIGTDQLLELFSELFFCSFLGGISFQSIKWINNLIWWKLNNLVQFTWESKISLFIKQFTDCCNNIDLIWVIVLKLNYCYRCDIKNNINESIYQLMIVNRLRVIMIKWLTQLTIR